MVKKIAIFYRKRLRDWTPIAKHSGYRNKLYIYILTYRENNWEKSSEPKLTPN